MSSKSFVHESKINLLYLSVTFFDITFKWVLSQMNRVHSQLLLSVFFPLWDNQQLADQEKVSHSVIPLTQRQSELISMLLLVLIWTCNRCIDVRFSELAALPDRPDLHLLEQTGGFWLQSLKKNQESKRTMLTLFVIEKVRCVYTI